MFWGVKRIIRQWVGVADQADIDFLRTELRDLEIALNHNSEYLNNEINRLQIRYEIIEKLNIMKAGRN